MAPEKIVPEKGLMQLLPKSINKKKLKEALWWEKGPLEGRVSREADRKKILSYQILPRGENLMERKGLDLRKPQ